MLQLGQDLHCEMAAFAVDCQPWNGGLFLAFLTSEELAGDQMLLDPAEMAAWKYYAFSRRYGDDRICSCLCSVMRAAYSAASGHQGTVADDFFAACAQAVASEQVQSAVRRFPLAADFHVFVVHPDSGKDYFKS